MPLLFDHPREPPGGYHFLDPSSYNIRAKSLRELLFKIAEYRAKNGMPPGNPYKEIETYYSTECPWLISNVGTSPVANEDPIARWINRTWRTPPSKWAESIQAGTRYGTCLDCPHYVADHSFSPESNRRLLILGAGHLGGMAGICKVHHWPVALACAVEKMEVTAEVEGCWVRTSAADASIQSTAH